MAQTPHTEPLERLEGAAMSEANKELVRRHFEEVFNRKNLAVCDETMAVNFVEHAAVPFSQT